MLLGSNLKVWYKEHGILFTLDKPKHYFEKGFPLKPEQNKAPSYFLKDLETMQYVELPSANSFENKIKKKNK